MIYASTDFQRLGYAHLNRMALAGYSASAAEQAGIMTLVHGLAKIGVSKFTAVYPFVGESAVPHAFDLMGNYDITWSGGLTHNAQGVTGNGSTGYGDTGFDCGAMSETDSHLACYTEGGTAGTRVTIGAGSAAAATGLTCIGLIDGGSKQAGTIGGINDPAPDDYAPTDAQGDASRDHFHCIDATTAQLQQYYREGVAHQDPVTARGTNQTSNIFIFIFAALLLKEKVTLIRGVAIVLGVGGALLVTFG